MIEQMASAVMEHDLSFNNGQIIIDGKPYSKATWGSEIGMEILSDSGVLLSFSKNFTGPRDQKSQWNRVFSHLESEYRNTMASNMENSEIPISLPQAEYIPVVDIKTNETHLIHPDLKEISELSFDAWQRTLSKEDKAMLNFRIRLAKFTYDPYDITTLNLVPFDGGELLKVNLYRPPSWRKVENHVVESIPLQIEKVLRHLFLDDSYEYVLDWLYHALIGRNETYLVLNGAKGVGKGIFCTIAKMLVGQENYVEAPDSLLDSNFNSALDKKRIIVLDEFNVDKEKHTKLKRYINKFQNIEKKGKDADKSVEIFNSYIISNNDESDMYLEPDDRRFSVADITEASLTKAMTGEEISALVTALEEDEGLAREFGYYIYNRGAVTYSEFDPLKGPKYDRLVLASLKTWQKLILEKLLEGEDMISLKRLRRDAKKKGDNFFPLNYSKISDFLRNFRLNGEERIGELVKEDGDYYIRNYNSSAEPDSELL